MFPEEFAWSQVSVYSMQHDAQLWPEPEAFQPERWVPGPNGRSPADAAPPGAWLPFGDGTRSCIGMRFARREALVTLARLFQRCVLCVCFMKLMDGVCQAAA